jgi:hypothetical protein
LESVLGATPQEFESLILRRADRIRRCIGYLQRISWRVVGAAFCGVRAVYLVQDRPRADAVFLSGEVCPRLLQEQGV